jgi:uncharacterized protein
MPLIVYIFLLVYSLSNYYIYRRVRSIIPSGPGRLAAAAAIVFLFSCYLLAELGQQFLTSGLTLVLRWIGSWWIGFLFYTVIILLLFDLVRLIGRVFHVFPPALQNPSLMVRRFGLSVIGGGVLLLLLAGHINARNLRINTVPLRLPPSCGHMKRLNLVLISDIHLGVMTGSSFLKEIINDVNNLNPDIILLGGDTVGMKIREIERLGYGEELSRFRAPLGVYAVTGNHEYISGVEEAVEFLSRAGIIILRDRAVKINNSFYLVGREDMSCRSGETIRGLLSGLDPDCPVILLDHRPTRIDEAIGEEVDLMLCGHTHNGQLFPINLITNSIYRVSNGYQRIRGTQIYVTSGAGTWAPPVRIGNVPEIVQLKIEFSPAP